MKKQNKIYLGIIAIVLVITAVTFSIYETEESNLQDWKN